MLLIYIDERTIHNMDNGITYTFSPPSEFRKSPYIEACGANAHHEDHSYGTWVATGEAAEIFWTWLKSQSMVPLPRMHALSPEIDAAVVELDVPRRFGLGARVTSINPDLMSRGMTGVVTAITPGRERVYTVRFNGDEYDDFAESELEPAD